MFWIINHFWHNFVSWGIKKDWTFDWLFTLNVLKIQFTNKYKEWQYVWNFVNIKIKNVYNPYFSGTTSHFYLESLLPFENTLVEYYKIGGVLIEPG